MTRQRILIDSGAIVAILSQNEQHHQRSTAELASLRPPLLAGWPVVTEAHWLLRHDQGAIDGLFRAFETSLLPLLSLHSAALPAMHTFLRRYRKLKPELTGRESIGTIFTLDRRDLSGSWFPRFHFMHSK